MAKKNENETNENEQYTGVVTVVKPHGWTDARANILLAIEDKKPKAEVRALMLKGIEEVNTYLAPLQGTKVTSLEVENAKAFRQDLRESLKKMG